MTPGMQGVALLAALEVRDGSANRLRTLNTQLRSGALVLHDVVQYS